MEGYPIKAKQREQMSSTNERVIWSCGDCRRVGSIPMRPECKMDARAMNEAMSKDHQALALKDAAERTPCDQRNVDYVPEWMIEGILREVRGPIQMPPSWNPGHGAYL